MRGLMDEEQGLFKVLRPPLMVSLSNHRRPSFDRLRDERVVNFHDFEKALDEEAVAMTTVTELQEKSAKLRQFFDQHLPTPDRLRYWRISYEYSMS